jgi:uncharacterized protein with HEPN domain
MAERGRSLPQLLENIVVWAERLARFVDGISEDAFAIDELRQAGASKCIEAIGEAAGEIERRYPQFLTAHPGIQLRQAYRARNRLAHGYDTIDWRLLWRTSVHHVPLLLTDISLLRDRYGADQ